MKSGRLNAMVVHKKVESIFHVRLTIYTVHDIDQYRKCPKLLNAVLNGECRIAEGISPMGGFREKDQSTKNTGR